MYDEKVERDLKTNLYLKLSSCVAPKILCSWCSQVHQREA